MPLYMSNRKTTYIDYGKGFTIESFTVERNRLRNYYIKRGLTYDL